MNPLFQSQETIAGKVLGFVVISSYQELYGIAFIGVFFFVICLLLRLTLNHIKGKKWSIMV